MVLKVFDDTHNFRTRPARFLFVGYLRTTKAVKFQTSTRVFQVHDVSSDTTTWQAVKGSAASVGVEAIAVQ